MHLPVIVEKEGAGEKYYDIYSRMFKDRIIFINGPIEENDGIVIASQLLYLDSLNNKNINMYISSRGGFISEALAIYDAMQHIKSPITTVVVGFAASAASLLAQAGSAGRRFLMENARTMIHEPSGGAFGKVTDIEIGAKEILIAKDVCVNIYHRHNSKGKTVEELNEKLKNDYYMSAQETIDFGLADEIIKRHK